MKRIVLMAVMATTFPCTMLTCTGIAYSQPETTQPWKILYFASRASSNRSQIFTMNPDGSGIVNLSLVTAVGDTSLRHKPEIDPAWSPDHKHIAFTVLTGTGRGDIYVMNADGTGRTRLTQLDTLAVCPAWSPDGQWIAFGTLQTVQGRTETGISTMDTDGSHLRRLGDGFLPAWSPDGHKILFTIVDKPGPPQLYIMDEDGAHARLLVQGGAAMGAWSPDGRQIAYIAPGADQKDKSLHLYVMNADTSQKRQLTTTPGDREFSPVWSADGQHIFFTRQARNHGPTSVCVMDADGQNATQLTPDASRAYLSAGLLVMLEGRWNESLANLKQIGTALYEYAAQHDGALPPMRDQQVLLQELLPYLDVADVLNQPDTQTPYHWNPLCSAQVPENFPKRTELIVVYEAEAAEHSRNVLFLDGHVARITEAEWARLKGISKIH